MDMIITRRGRLPGSAITRWLVVAVTAVAASVAIAPGRAPAAPTTQALPAKHSAPFVAASVTITVKVSCPRTHRGTDGLPYCDRSDGR
jgi:hypothetical protein